MEVGGITTAAYKSDAYSSVLGTHLTKYAMEPVHNHLKQKKIILIS
jgi:hypothetical protein